MEDSGSFATTGGSHTRNFSGFAGSFGNEGRPVIINWKALLGYNSTPSTITMPDFVLDRART